MKSIILILVGALLLFVSAPVVRAADSKENELQKRFEKRDKEIRQLKKAGVIGETADGYVDWVKDEDKKNADVVNDENADRKELYQHIADKTKTTVEKVAERAAKRNFERAASGEYLKDENGKWKKKS
jgi:uncharacterized protein YdbL (DUF1318 family)